MNDKKPVKIGHLIQKPILLTTIMTYFLGERVPRDPSHLKVKHESKTRFMFTYYHVDLL